MAVPSSSTITWKSLSQLTYPGWEMLMYAAFLLITTVIAVIDLYQFLGMRQQSFLNFLIENWQLYGVVCCMASGVVFAFLLSSWGLRFLIPHKLVIQHTACVFLEIVTIWAIFGMDLLQLLLGYSVLWALLILTFRHPAPLWILAVVSFLCMFFEIAAFSLISGAIFTYFQCRAIIIGTDLMQLWQAPDHDMKWECICGALRYFFYPCTLLSGSMIGLRQFLHYTSHPKVLVIPRNLVGRMCILLLSGSLYVICKWVYATCHTVLSQLEQGPIVTVFSGCILIGQFHLFHSLLYGIPYIIGMIDGILWTGQPVCIFGALSFAELWRNFDKGLFFFMNQYIYRPLGGNRVSTLQKLFNSACCFAFVCLFHGPYYEIYCWIVVNFILVHVEHLSDQWMRQSGTRLAATINVSESMQRRIRVLLQSQLFLLCGLFTLQFFGLTHLPRKFWDSPDMLSLYGYMSVWHFSVMQLTLYCRRCAWYPIYTHIEFAQSERSHGLTKLD